MGRPDAVEFITSRVPLYKIIDDKSFKSFNRSFKPPASDICDKLLDLQDETSSVVNNGIKSEKHGDLVMKRHEVENNFLSSKKVCRSNNGIKSETDAEIIMLNDSLDFQKENNSTQPANGFNKLIQHTQMDIEKSSPSKKSKNQSEKCKDIKNDTPSRNKRCSAPISSNNSFDNEWKPKKGHKEWTKNGKPIFNGYVIITF